MELRSHETLLNISSLSERMSDIVGDPLMMPWFYGIEAPTFTPLKNSRHITISYRLEQISTPLGTE
jgi:hypothetical protein